MAKPTGGASGGFVDVLEAAQRVPAPPQVDGRDLSDGFPLPVQPHHRVVDTSKEPDDPGTDGLAAYDFTAHTRGFTIYRPWNACTRCMDAIANQKTELPNEGDYECPHTNVVAYNEVIDKILTTEYMGQATAPTVLQDGTHVVVMTWYVKKLNHGRARRMARDARRGAGMPPTASDD